MSIVGAFFSGPFYRYWEEGTASNGRPYWDLANTTEDILPSASVAPPSADWGFMYDFGESLSWDSVTFTFSSGDPTQITEFSISNVSTGAVYGTGESTTPTTLTLTRASLTYSGNVGSGAGVSIPATARYFGFGGGGAGADAFVVSGVSYT